MNGITTRSPGSIWVTFRSDRLDDAHRLVAKDVAFVHKRAEHLVQMKSDPQIPVDVILTIASVGSSIAGSGTVSTRTSRFP